MKNLFLVILACLLLSVSCKKEKDIITPRVINGRVYNNCTDSGLAGVSVYLKIIKDNSEYKSYKMVSGTDGNFSFSNVEIHSSSNYSYVIYIPSKSGEQATTPEYCRFDGTEIYFNSSEFDVFFKPRVTPGFLLLKVYYSSLTATSNDTVITNFSQNIFQKNVPMLPYSLNGGAYGNTPLLFDHYGNYPMGKYNITIESWKSGLYTIKKDSIYLGWGSTNTYTVNW